MHSWHCLRWVGCDEEILISRLILRERCVPEILVVYGINQYKASKTVQCVWNYIFTQSKNYELTHRCELCWVLPWLFTWRNKILDFVVCVIRDPRIYLFSCCSRIWKLHRLNWRLEIFQGVSESRFYLVTLVQKCTVGELQSLISRRYLLASDLFV